MQQQRAFAPVYTSSNRLSERAYGCLGAPVTTHMRESTCTYHPTFTHSCHTTKLPSLTKTAPRTGSQRELTGFLVLLKWGVMWEFNRMNLAV